MTNRDLSPWRSPATYFDPFLSFRREIDRVFDDFFTPETTRSLSPVAATLRPSVDLKETDKAYILEAELPGLDPKDVQVDLRDNILSITGDKREEKSGEDGGLSYRERSFGHFERRIPLALEVDPDRIEARFRNGVLHIEAYKNPKAQEKSRHIPIKPS